MPAVLIEPGSIKDEVLRLADPGVRRRVAQAIAEGIDRFFRAKTSSA